MPSNRIDLKIDPCAECPIPTNFIVTHLGKKDDNTKYGIECRECGEKWTELVDE
jgi:hypothetical protein